MDRRLRRLGSTIAWTGLAAVVLTATGCVERRYTIRTDPPGAVVVVNGQEIGTTPVSKSFVYYGDRDIKIYKDGFRTEQIIQPVGAPWWDNYFTEFFTENVIPVTFRDEREFVYRLTPDQSPTTQDLLNRAEQLRAESQAPPTPRRGGILGFFGF